jgi:internalin A
MDDKPRRMLQDIARTYGAGVLNDPRRCRAFLMDFCGEYRGEINLLDMALREGIPGELMAAASTVPRGLVVARLVQRLKDGYFLPDEAARWAVEACEDALSSPAADRGTGRVFRSDVTATVSAREWLTGDRTWQVIGVTPGEVELPPGVELRLSVRIDDAGAEQLAGQLELAGGIHQLDLSHSSITDRGLVALVTVVGLVSMDLSRTPITLTELPPSVERSSLKEVNLWGTAELKDDSLGVLAQIEGLERVELGRCSKITDAGLAQLSTLRGLMYLGLSGTRVSDRGLASFSELLSLRHLDLSGTEITGEGLCYLSSNPMLETLDLFGCVGLRPESLAVLRHFSALAELRLGRCGMVADQAMAYLRPLVGLAGLSLEGLEVSDAGILYLMDLTALSRLDVAWTQIGDAGVARISSLSNLRDLSLAGTRMTDAGLSHLVRLPDLVDLDLSNTGVTDAGLRTVSSLRSLKGLDLEGTAIHDAGLVHLGVLPELRLLYLGDTAITDVGLALLSRVTNVEVVGVAMCSGVSPQGIDELEKLGIRVNQ